LDGSWINLTLHIEVLSLKLLFTCPEFLEKNHGLIHTGSGFLRWNTVPLHQEWVSDSHTQNESPS
jgi:hypothetical protein